MTITIKIDTGNAAFSEAGSGTETARILRELADRLDPELSRNDCRPLRDFNGNRVGEFKTSKR